MTGHRSDSRRDVVVVGSGFAGSTLARILATQGLGVVLVEKGSHPRFALGESSTPLAGFCLERLARCYDLPDLCSLAAYGRWQRDLPRLRCGLKRGFTFFAHHRGEVYRNGEDNDRRLLVAASPSDAVADTHWLREDVDHHCLVAARAAGAEVHLETHLTSWQEGDGVSRVSGQGPRGAVTWEAPLLVDATGRGGFLASQGAVRRVAPPSLRPASLLYTHLEGEGRFDGVGDGSAPYPDEAAAIHHLLKQGWLYRLPFDHGVSSVGFVAAEDDELSAREPEVAWNALLRRYPSLDRQLATARPLQPIRRISEIRHRLETSFGATWVVLPNTFFFADPMFSTGIAWSLLAVERLAAAGRELLDPVASSRHRATYGDMLRLEADHVEDLVEGAYAALPSFRLFAAFSQLYFAAASFQELRQRLVLAEGAAAWEGFLGATDPVSRSFVREGRRRLEALRARHGSTVPRQEEDGFAAWVRQAIEPRNVAGLADPHCRNLYPVDLDVLLERRQLLGLSRPEIEAALPRLRGEE